MNDSWMTINSINHSQKQQEEVCFYDGVPPIHVPPNHDLATDCGKLLLCLLFWCLVKHRGLAIRFWVWRCPNEFTNSHENSGHYQLPFLLLQSFQRIVGRCQVPPRWIAHTFPGLSDQKADGGKWADAADTIVFLVPLLPTNFPPKDLHVFRLLQTESRHVVKCCPIGWLSMRYKTGIVLWTTGLSLTCC